MWRSGAVAACLLAASGAVTGSHAADKASTADGWQASLTPYVWAAGFDGDVAALPPLPTVSVDASFGDIIENTDIAAMLAGELRNGRFAILGDFVYTALSADGSTPGGLFSGVDFETDTTILSGVAAYRFYETGTISLDGFAGLRAWWVSTDVELRGDLLATRQRSYDESWADGIVGMQLNTDLGNGFALNLLGDVGGGGSDFTWEIRGGLAYTVNDWLLARAGYRHLAVDYENDAFVWDVELSGPIVGATITF